MNNAIYLLFLILLFHSCSSEKITVKKEMPPLPSEAPFVAAFKNNEIVNSSYLPLTCDNNYMRLHEYDVTAKNSRQKIGTLKLSDNKNRIQQIQIYLKLENAVRRMGGNYVVVTDLIQKFEPVFRNKLVADVYYVEDLNDYELSFKWSPKRDIELKDYNLPKNKNLETYVISGLKYSTRLFGGPQQDNAYIELLNEFVRNENHCHNCTPLDILRENLKFDLIELYQRKITKGAFGTTFYVMNLNQYQYPLLDSLEVEKNRIDSIENIDQLKIISEKVNNNIELLDKYSDKKLMVTFNKTNSNN
ncbi:MAG: hypothetical protein R2788_10870 [Saprospiraceae bacterium]